MSSYANLARVYPADSVLIKNTITMISTDLKGNDIILRRLRRTDAESLAHHCNDREISRFITHISYPYSTDNAAAWIKKADRLMKRGGEIHFGVSDRNTDRVIGVIGLKRINRHDQNAEIEYWIGKKHRNQGKAAEAIALILEYAFGKAGLRRVYAVVHQKNIGSVKVLEKSGFTREGTWRKASRRGNEWCDVYAYGMLKEEFGGRD